MKNKFLFLGFLISLMLTGCNAAINFQGKVAGISYGKFFYEDGNFISEYKTDMDAVWKACEKAVFDLKATDVQEERKISSGSIEAVIQGEKSVIKVEYIDRNVTSVSIFVGSFGNTVASRLIHEKIIGNLATH
jgi:prepilin signal peptidase PulO-like enzyme (type II secretory pathway)